MKVLITGATRGIGKAIAKALADPKNHLVLIARNKSDLTQVQKELSTSALKVDLISVDLSKSEFLTVLKQQGDLLENISVIINNVGIYTEDAPTEINRETILNQLNINLFGALELTNFLLSKNSIKKIININSVMGVSASQQATTYSISKHALKAWNDALREELRPKNITVSSIYPGAVNTSSWDGIEADREKMIQPEDVSSLVATLLKLTENTLVEEIRISPTNFN